MCGRFTTVATAALFAEAFPGVTFPPDFTARYNVAPTQPIPVLTNENPQEVQFFRWGLIPSWAKDPSIGARLINARAETLATKPAFRAAFRRRRCLILADGFYEWGTPPGERARRPFFVRLASGRPFVFAGLWEGWRPPEGEPIHSCAIVTTAANSMLAPIHDRMPVILPPPARPLWLDPGVEDPATLKPLLVPFAHEALQVTAVGKAVNNARHDAADCIQPSLLD